MTKRLVAVVIVLGSVAGAWVLWDKAPTTGRTAEKQETGLVIETAVSEDAQLNSEGESQQAESNLTHPAVDGYKGKRIVHVPDSRTGVQPSEIDINAQHLVSINDQIDSALNGNADDAMSVVQLVHRCLGTPEDRPSLEALLNFHRMHSELPLTMTVGMLGFAREFDSFEEWSSAQWRRYQNCKSEKVLIGDDLRARLETQARNGNAVARFMYAMLQPLELTGDPNELIVQLEYESLAYQFTMQNIQEQNPLGLFALGISYRGNLFTPFQSHVGRAFILAAERCGLSHTLIHAISDDMRDDRSDIARMYSEVIVREFCN